MAKSIDQQLSSKKFDEYWNSPQFKKGDFKIFQTDYDGFTRGKNISYAFDAGDVISPLCDDLCEECSGGWVSCFTKRGVLKLRRTVIIQYTRVQNDNDVLT